MFSLKRNEPITANATAEPADQRPRRVVRPPVDIREEEGAFLLVADLPELGKLDRGQIAKLVGVAPLNCDSGQRRGPRRIRGGRHDVRLTLYMAAFNACLHNPRFRAFADRLGGAGKPFKQLIAACMRKLLTLLNAMARDGLTWDQLDVVKRLAA